MHRDGTPPGRRGGEPVLIGLDIGSSSAKAILVDARGRIRRAARVRFPTRRLPGGRVEHDAAALLRASIAALEQSAAGLPARGTASLGIATQRSTVLFWDRDSGRAVTPAYSWQDLRAAAWTRRLTLRGGSRRSGALPADGHLNDRVAERTGLRVSAHYAAPKLAWALKRLPGLRRRVARGQVLWGTLGTWLAWHLTRGGLYCVDHANAQRTLLLHLGSLSWDPALFDLFGLGDLFEAPALPALVPTRSESGALARVAGRSLALRAMTGDQQAALQGLLCRRAGDMAINYGSGAFVLMQVGSEPVRVRGLLTTLVASRHLRPGEPDRPSGCIASFAVEGTVNAASTALDWVGRRIGRRIRVADLDATLGAYDPSASRRVHFLPAVSGLGAPRWDERARPRFMGRIDAAAPRDLLRAAVESIAQRCAEIAAAAAARAPGAARRARGAVRVSGGLTRCRYLLQAQADLLQRPIAVSASRDATAIGAALLALEDSATWPDLGKDVGRSTTEVVEPRSGPARAASLRRAWARAVHPGAGVRQAGSPAASSSRRSTNSRSRKARNQPARGPLRVPRKAR
jgi:glycerol kinase